jgi:hypothetical protein
LEEHHVPYNRDASAISYAMTPVTRQLHHLQAQSKLYLD